MLSFKLFLAALLVAPCLTFQALLPIQFTTAAATKTRKAPNGLAATGGVTISVSNDGPDKDEERYGNKMSLPRELMPITMGVFAQMLGEGISLSSLPLYLTRLGASPTSVGLAISCFSLAQMTFAPILVGLSSRVGRSIVLRICLAGAVASSLLIAFSGNVYGIVAGRALAGVFAACVPVAQSGVTDILDKNQTAIGLSRVSAASQLGVVVGPAVSAVFQEGLGKLGLPSSKCLPAVFCLNSLFTLSVLVQMTFMNRRLNQRSNGRPDKMGEEEEQQIEASAAAVEEKPSPAPAKNVTFRYAQTMLRTITIAIGWTAILSNSIYGLFAPKYLGFSQPQLSATYSFAAALMVGMQVVLPKLVEKFGEYRLCTIGILTTGIGIGGQSLLRFQPLHTFLYMMNRAGAAVADTSTATLVARSSANRDARSRNLALLTSTRAAGRIITPLLSSKLFELSCRQNSLVPYGALPFVVASCLAIVVSPLPSVVHFFERQQQRRSEPKKSD